MASLLSEEISKILQNRLTDPSDPKTNADVFRVKLKAKASKSNQKPSKKKKAKASKSNKKAEPKIPASKKAKKVRGKKGPKKKLSPAKKKAVTKKTSKKASAHKASSSKKLKSSYLAKKRIGADQKLKLKTDAILALIKEYGKGHSKTYRIFTSLDENIEALGSITAEMDKIGISLNLGKVSRKVGSTKNTGIAQWASAISPLDVNKSIHTTTASFFAKSVSEKICPETMRSMKDKPYIALWTNRVALWWFFERYYKRISQEDPQLIDALSKTHFDAIKSSGQLGDAKFLAHKFAQNPFYIYEKSFNYVLEAWSPRIKKGISIFVQNTQGGDSLRDDFLSIGYIAFLYALEKQAMAILSNALAAQRIPFHKRLGFAVKKAIYCDLPDFTGPVRVPIESEARKTMPQGVSIDDLGDNYGDSNY